MAVCCATQLVASTVVCSSEGQRIYFLNYVGCGLCIGLIWTADLTGCSAKCG